jgi:hypothetical protein
VSTGWPTLVRPGSTTVVRFWVDTVRAATAGPLTVATDVDSTRPDIVSARLPHFP